MKKILYVDDARSMRQLVELVLTEHHDITLAEDGLEALELSKQSQYDLVISDVNMPNMNGFELLENLRKNPDYKFVPILMLTTEADDDMKQKGKQLGATGWIIKPFDPNKLLKVIERVTA